MSHTNDLSLRRLAAATIAASATLSLLACTTMGTGSGMLEPGDLPVSFAWTSKDAGTTGTMTATIHQTRQSVADGGVFVGPFMHITSSVRTDAIEPMWSGWSRGWNDWGYWGMFPETVFSTHYSGKVIANLQGPGTQRMRCRFHLNTPAAGMGGGGQGECQFNGGRTIDAVFAPL